MRGSDGVPGVDEPGVDEPGVDEPGVDEPQARAAAAGRPSAGAGRYAAARPDAPVGRGGEPGGRRGDATGSGPVDPAFPRPGGLVVGVGLRRSAAPAEVLGLIRRALAEAGLCSTSVVRLATLAGKAAHPAVRRAAARLGADVDEHPAEVLAGVAVPSPSAAVADAVGSVSVAEAAALASAPGGQLVVPKRKSAAATVAVVRVPGGPADAPASGPARPEPLPVRPETAPAHPVGDLP
ncbi:cobalamin biosynthesis protein [Kitasatospora hibisci]|uniref:cobalamin biosynthesis protein n=1 Tax=Kitasatospora hibisci TaxID=3369522 RepID=UPI003753F140